jgi:serine protease Do
MKKTLIFLLFTASAFAGERDDKVNGDKSAFEDSNLWIYNDLDTGFERARETGKPMLVVYRCVP